MLIPCKSTWFQLDNNAKLGWIKSLKLALLICAKNAVLPCDMNKNRQTDRDRHFPNLAILIFVNLHPPLSWLYTIASTIATSIVHSKLDHCNFLYYTLPTSQINRFKQLNRSRTLLLWSRSLSLSNVIRNCNGHVTGPLQSRGFVTCPLQFPLRCPIRWERERETVSLAVNCNGHVTDPLQSRGLVTCPLRWDRFVT